jgi:hypothetical protein
MLSLYLPLVLAPLSSLAILAGSRSAPIRQVFIFPNNTFIENIAVRSNSKILLTSESVNTLFTLDPTVHFPSASVLHTFPDSNGLSGITETTHDVFAVVTGVWDLFTTRAALGSLSIWTINLRSSTPVIKHITSIANSTIFNGITTVPGSPNLILAADSAIGAVWRVDILTGQYDIAFSDPLFTPLGTDFGQNLGINGIRAKGNYLYFANSAQNIYGRIRIDNWGRKVGNVEVIASQPVTGGHYDDFAIDGSGTAWIATHPINVVKVKPNGVQTIIEDDVLLLNPTSAAFGRGGFREEKTLYVTNGGWFVGNDLINEGVVAIDTTQF